MILLTSAIIVAAGSGSRMGLNINKVMYKLGNKRVFMYSIDTFKKYCDEIILVISEADKDVISELPKDIKYTFGGKTRGESVYNGLKIAKGDYVLIHDAARPFIDKNVIANIVSNKKDDEAVLTYLDSVDTLRLRNDQLELLNRDEIIRAVTPQCANKDIMIDSYLKSFKDNLVFTDDIALISYYHKEIKIKLLKANNESFKLTYPFDLKLAEVIWRDYD